ncbi:MAG: hypothetical protein EP329_06100 [Deltaproteobacteria bacterium]|nr:MAG: hypothetical protein EP329_06100 [Deltaproteobacteria bacterium]
MSVMICFVARTGVVLGTDSRVTTRFTEGETREDAYPKLVQFGSLPVALGMVGVGAYGGLDFRALVAETHRSFCRGQAEDETGPAERVEAVARLFADTVAGIARDAGATAEMNVLVAGYSPGAAFGELWEVRLPTGEVTSATRAAPTFVWRGQTDAVKTLWWGAHLGALQASLDEAGVAPDVAKAVTDGIKRRTAWGPERTNWGMPLSSAVDLVRFQLELQIAYERFMPGRGTCGPPTQIVAINDAGLRWMDNPFEAFSQVARTPAR